MTDIGTVIGWKFNHQPGMSTRDGVITEFPGGIPTQADQDTWATEYEAHVSATQYQRDRKEEYPSVTDFLEAYTEKEIGGDSAKWDAYIINYNKVRADNPK